MHGRLRAARCTTCDHRTAWDGPLRDRPACPVCDEPTLRPDVVWFGEVPHDMDVIERELWECDLFVSIGTSGLVYPAAAFVHYAVGNGKRALELNLDASGASGDVHESRRGPATELVPAWVDEVLGGGVTS
jgi:NAD-dependent deacetylase